MAYLVIDENRRGKAIAQIIQSNRINEIVDVKVTWIRPRVEFLSDPDEN